VLATAYSEIESLSRICDVADVAPVEPRRYSSSRSAFVFFAISTRYAMLPAQPGTHAPRWLRAARLRPVRTPKGRVRFACKGMILNTLTPS
jgi:hypothetical protein